MRFLMAWAFFLVGDLVSRPMYWSSKLAWLYRPYNWLMVTSHEIQGDGTGPWKDA